MRRVPFQAGGAGLRGLPVVTSLGEDESVGMVVLLTGEPARHTQHVGRQPAPQNGGIAGLSGSGAIALTIAFAACRCFSCQS